MSRRSLRMSASVVADVCVGRYGCLRRSVRMPALVGADGENKAKAEVNASAFVVLYRLLGWCSRDCCTPWWVCLFWLVRWLFPTDFALLIKSICVPRNLWENFLAEGSVCSAKSVGDSSQQKVLCVP